MIFQLLLGLGWVVFGGMMILGVPCLERRLARYFSRDTLAPYMKRSGTMVLLLGVVMITMGQAEYWLAPPAPLFALVYLMLALPCVFTLLCLNKRYGGKWLLFGA